MAANSASNAKISVWWDIENCQVPAGVEPEAIAPNVRSVLQRANLKGPFTISAYGDTTLLTRPVQTALTSTGVQLHHIPSGRKDASDKAILVDMILWALDNPPPGHILLISGDRDFSNALHKLRMKTYDILLAQPRNVAVSSHLRKAASTVWYWYNLAQGEAVTELEALKIENMSINPPTSSGLPRQELKQESNTSTSGEHPFSKNQFAQDGVRQMGSSPQPNAVNSGRGYPFDASRPTGQSVWQPRPSPPFSQPMPPVFHNRPPMTSFSQRHPPPIHFPQNHFSSPSVPHNRFPMASQQPSPMNPIPVNGNVSDMEAKMVFRRTVIPLLRDWLIRYVLCTNNGYNIAAVQRDFESSTGIGLDATHPLGYNGMLDLFEKNFSDIIHVKSPCGGVYLLYAKHSSQNVSLPRNSLNRSGSFGRGEVVAKTWTGRPSGGGQVSAPSTNITGSFGSGEVPVEQTSSTMTSKELSKPQVSDSQTGVMQVKTPGSGQQLRYVVKPPSRTDLTIRDDGEKVLGEKILLNVSSQAVSVKGGNDWEKVMHDKIPVERPFGIDSAVLSVHTENMLQADMPVSYPSHTDPDSATVTDGAEQVSQKELSVTLLSQAESAVSSQEQTLAVLFPSCKKPVMPSASKETSSTVASPAKQVPNYVDKVLLDCRTLLLELFSSHPEGFSQVKLQESFRRCYGYELDHIRAGFNTFDSLLEFIPDDVRVETGVGGQLILPPVRPSFLAKEDGLREVCKVKGDEMAFAKATAPVKQRETWQKAAFTVKKSEEYGGYGEKLLQDCKILLQRSLRLQKGEYNLAKLPRDFEDSFGYSLDYRRAGYNKLSDLLDNFEDFVGTRSLPHRVLYLKSVPPPVREVNAISWTDLRKSVNASEGALSLANAISLTNVAPGSTEAEILADDKHGPNAAEPVGGRPCSVAYLVGPLLTVVGDSSSMV